MSNLSTKLKFDYIEFKRKVLLLYGIWFFAVIAGLSLIAIGEFTPVGRTVKLLSFFIACLLFLKIGYDISKGVHKDYAEKFQGKI